MVNDSKLTKDPVAQRDANHGEGNPEAAARFNAAEQRFVQSPGGQDKIRAGAKVQPGEEAALVEAEQLAKAHAKAQDSPKTWGKPPKA